MRKGIRAIAIATIVTIAIMLSCAYAMPAIADEYGEFYPRLTIVIDTKEDSVLCQDKEGNIWMFFSYEDDWKEGDICNLLIWNNSTDITQHEIIEVYWEGCTEDIEQFFIIMNWAH